MSAHILLVEDDSFLSEGLTELLTGEGYLVTTAASCAAARAALQATHFDLVTLDVMLPDGSGLVLCTELRQTGKDVPVLFLTACDDEIQIVRGLDAGGDDYVTKPFKLRELLSRIRALLRRHAGTVYEAAGLHIDLGTRTVRRNGEAVLLTPTEFGILSVLVRNAGIIVTRGSLLQSIWDDAGNYIDDNTLSVHISRLREKIGTQAFSTVRGVGYRWEEQR